MGQEPDSTPQQGETPDVEAVENTQSAAGAEAQAESPRAFDAVYVKQLRAENAKHRKEAQEAKQRVTEFEEANASDLEKAQGKLTKAEQRASEAEAKLLRYAVAQEKEVPAKLVPLLTAADKEGLEAQADLILENAKAPETPSFDGGAREPAPEAKTPEEQHNDLAVQLFGIPR